MNTEERRKQLLERLEHTDKPLTGSLLAKEFDVSRQIIVGDIGIIRAMGKNIYATPRGYIIPSTQTKGKGIMATIACRHDAVGLKAELETIVDNGGFVRDVIVEHPLYGELRGDLMISTRHEVDMFLQKMAECKASPLLVMTGGVHLHTLEVADEGTLERIRQELKRQGILAREV